MNHTKNTLLFFKKQPLSPETTPDAVFIRDMGECQHEKVCEIDYLGSKWIVRYSEVKTLEEGMKALAEKWEDEIETATFKAFPEITFVAIARQMGISPATLRKRRKWLEGQA